MSAPTASHLDDGVNLGTAFKALNNPLRRRILADLQTDDEVDVETYATDREGSHSIELQLRHTHLPCLEDYGFIDWNHETDVIRRGPLFQPIEPLLQVLDEHQEELPGAWP